MDSDPDPPAAPGAGEPVETERRQDALADLDLRSTAEQVALANALDAQVAPAVAAAADAVVAAVDAVVDRLRRGGRLRYLGAGSAGRLAELDAAELPATFGVPADLVRAVVAGGPGGAGDAGDDQGLEDDAAAGRADVAALRLTGLDVLVGVSASGRTPYVLAGAAQAAGDGALTVAVVSTLGSPLAAACDLAVEVVTGPELIAGSTRLRAGTAQKLVLNQISTLAMVALGHTYGNLMVGLRADNAKLVRRRRRVVELATGADPAAVDAAMAASGGDAKVALVMLLAGVDVERAGAHLEAAGGLVRAAVRLASPADG